MARVDDELELEEEVEYGGAPDEDEQEAEGEFDEDEKPAPKAKAKVKPEPKAKTSKSEKAAKPVEEAESKTTKKIAKKGGKEPMATASVKTKAASKKKQSLFQRHGVPGTPGTLFFKGFKLASKGIAVSKFDSFIKENASKKGGTWVKAFIRNKNEDGYNGATWKVKEENGFLKVYDVKAA